MNSEFCPALDMLERTAGDPHGLDLPGHSIEVLAFTTKTTPKCQWPATWRVQPIENRAEWVGTWARELLIEAEPPAKADPAPSNLAPKGETENTEPDNWGSKEQEIHIGKYHSRSFAMLWSGKLTWQVKLYI